MTEGTGTDEDEQRARFARLFDATPFVVSVYAGPDHAYVYTNPTGRERVAERPYLGRPFKEVWPELDAEGMTAAYDDVLRSGETQSRGPYQIRAADSIADGATPPRWAKQTIQRWQGEDGASAGVMTFLHDATSEVESTLEARRAADRLEFALSAGRAVGTWDWDLSGDLVVVDDRLAAVFGLEDEMRPEGIPVERFLGRVHGSDRSRIRRAVMDAKEGLRDYDEDFRTTDSGGSVRWVHGHGRRLEGEGDAPARFPGVAVEITERKSAEVAQEESQARLEAALRAGGLGVYDYDIPADVIDWDDRVRQLWGVGPDDPVNLETFRASLHPDDIERVDSEVEEALSPGGVPRFETTCRVVSKQDGKVRWVEIEGDVSFDGDESVRVVGIVLDVTKAREAEAHRKLLMRELDHRVKNLLAVVQAIAMQTFKSVAGAEGAMDAFRGRLQALAAGQTVLAEGMWAGGSLKGALRGALDGCGAAPERVSMTGPPVTLSPHQTQTIALVTHELCTNASKYGALSVPDGRVEIAWEVTEAEASQEAEGGEVEGNTLRVSWTERDGPPVEEPERQGFGTQLIAMLLRGEGGGEAELSYAREGVRCRLRLPL